MARKKIKTLKEWEKKFPDKELDEYLQTMDEVDEDLHLYCGEIVAPQYLSHELLQMGEAEDKKNGVYFFVTFITVNGRYYYLGPMPEFKQ